MLQVTSQYITMTTAIVAITLNLLLLPLIAFKSSPLMGSYKYLLFLYTLHSVVYAAFAVTINPLFYVSDGIFLIVFYENFANLSIFSGSLILLIYICCWIQIVIIVTLCFLHRYWTLVKSHHESWFRSPQKIIILVVGDLLLTGASGALTSWGSWPNDSKNRLMEPDLLYNTGINISTVPYIGGPEWINDTLRVATALPSIICIIFTAVSLTFIFFMIIKIFAIFRKTLPQMHRQNIRYQERIFYLLLFQTFSPLIFTISPGVTFHFCALFKINFLRGTIILFSSLMSFAQCIDPIVTFLLVYEYRRAVRQFISSWTKLEKESSKKTNTHK